MNANLTTRIFLDKPHFELHFQENHFVLFQYSNTQYNQQLENKWCKNTIKFIRSNSNDIKRLQYNTKKFINYVIIDLDHNNFDVNELDIPIPNFIVKNKRKEGMHLFYVLEKTIFGTDEYHKKIWNKVFKYFTHKTNGDDKAVGFIGKNIWNKYDFEYVEFNPFAYSLEYLNSTVKPFYKQLELNTFDTQIISKLKKPHRAVEHSRNCEIFDNLRKYAYAEIKEKKSVEDFKFKIKIYANKLNSNFEKKLNDKEINCICRSITKYCLKHKTNILNYVEKKKLQLDDNMSIKEKLSLGGKYTKAVRVEKTKLEIQKAVLELREKNEKVTSVNISEITKISRQTVSKYKELFK